MKLKDGMILYHGSYTPVQNIDLTKCAAGKDFGKGFYVTADEDGITWQEARSKIINSAAYTALYDFENGLWENGPDYFRDYYKKIA